MLADLESSLDTLAQSAQPAPPPAGFLSAVRARRRARRMGQAATFTAIVLIAGTAVLLVPRPHPAGPSHQPIATLPPDRLPRPVLPSTSAAFTLASLRSHNRALDPEALNLPESPSSSPSSVLSARDLARVQDWLHGS
jgi:hypothetical protein